MAERPGKAALRIDDLHVYYGESHAIQGVSLTLERGVLAVLGRNGMGKTTLCNTIVGLKRSRSGVVRVEGREISSLEPHEIHRLGVSYVPQGRRCWPSLTVDEHLRLAAGSRRDAAWTVERIYQTFPRLAERRNNGGSQLSGGEQQMLAIARALLNDPKLLIMDEPTEGLAPIIVGQVEQLLVSLAAEDEMAILVIEQNIGVATTVSDQVAIMVNGRINRIMEARTLAADRDLQRRLLGVGRHADEDPVSPADASQAEQRLAAVYQIERNSPDRESAAGWTGAFRPVTELPNRWSASIAAPPTTAVVKGAPEDRLEKFRNSLCRADRPHRDRRRDVRHQGQGASLHCRSPESAGRSGAHRRSFDLGKAFERRRVRHAGGEHASKRTVGGHVRGPRTIRHRDGRGLRPLDRARAAHRRRHLRRRLRRHDARDRRDAGAADRRSQDHDLDGRRRRHRQICRRRRHHDVSFGRRRSRAEFDHRAGSWQRRACAGRHDRAIAHRRSARGQAKIGASGARHHDVRRHDALRPGSDQGARSRL